MTEIDIKAGGKISPVLIGKGLSASFGSFVRSEGRFGRIFTVSDDIVFRLLGKRVETGLEQAGIRTGHFVFPHGEKNKSLITVQQAAEAMAAAGLQRGDAVLALGGGVAGDLAGFASAIYMRGLALYQMPTTLLAMIDAAIGGKNGADAGSVKNLIGTFHFPEAVLIDTDILLRQPDRLIRDGSGEMLKYGVLTGGELFEMLKAGTWLRHRIRCVEECVRYKAGLVGRDPEDRGERRLLNLGHTFGHAIEAVSDFRITHGEAVAMGIRMAFGAAECDPGEYLRTMKKCGLDVKCPFTADRLYGKMLSDKKRAGEKTPLILPLGIGRCDIVPVTDSELEKCIRRGLAV